jgi:hypothetical protein
MINNFEGIYYRLANNWFQNLNIDDYKNIPIKYLEIGTFYGANLISVAKSYGLHNDSKLYCIDPWEDYEDYPEYKTEQPTIYNTFLKNIENSGYKNKIIVNRGYSNREVLKFEDDFFDIIYIDGNHEPEYVLEDAVLCFRKLKKNGIMIFDDYDWGGPDLTQRGIDAFLHGFCKRITVLGLYNGQVFIKKNNYNKPITKDDIITSDKFLNTFPQLYYNPDCFFSESIVWRNRVVCSPNKDLPIIISGHSDISIEDYLVDVYNPTVWFTTNNQSTRSNVYTLPLGLSNNTTESELHPIYGNIDIVIDVINDSSIVKKGLVYMNFNVDTHHERKKVFHLFNDLPWVKTGEIKNTLEGRKVFLQEIKAHYFVLCPRGNGLDTHRLWETLYMGSIPIVKRDLGYAEFYDLPICFVNDWEEVTEEFLKEEKRRITSILYCLDKLKIGYWIDKIKKTIQ